ncbi:MAG: LemA family protein [Candidatus Cloacimonetes bacterium]|nr:LemA family protein [Candidatus Cloacimonadota bacterium]NLO12193.1 LemA family protein [Candidatus Cloacimonadota bacterium]
MKKGYIVIVAIILLIVIIAGYTIGRYNKIRTLKVEVDNKWGQVQNQYQRRFDLIPNLVSTVQGAANFEKSTLTDVVEARAKVGQMNVNPELINDPEAFARFEEAQAGLSSALNRLMVVVENYPELKANQNFLQLQDQLEGTENRITTERGRFNDSVSSFNKYVVVFPNNIIASIFGMRPLPFFQAAVGAEEAPRVQFD